MARRVISVFRPLMVQVALKQPTVTMVLNVTPTPLAVGVTLVTPTATVV